MMGNGRDENGCRRSAEGVPTAFGPGVQIRFQHGLVAPDRRVLLHVRFHLGFVVQGEEAPQQRERVADDDVGDAVILDVEKAAPDARVLDVPCDALAVLQRPVLEAGQVNRGDRREGRRRLVRDLTVRRLGARVKVDILLVLLDAPRSESRGAVSFPVLSPGLVELELEVSSVIIPFRAPSGPALAELQPWCSRCVLPDALAMRRHGVAEENDRVDRRHARVRILSWSGVVGGKGR